MMNSLPRLHTYRAWQNHRHLMTKRSQSLRDLAGVNQTRIRHIDFNQPEIGDPHGYTRSSSKGEAEATFPCIAPHILRINLA